MKNALVDHQQVLSCIEVLIEILMSMFVVLGVLRDALQMLTKKSMEESPMSLRPEQIDLAWRQMKIERLKPRSVDLTKESGSPEGNVECENIDPNEQSFNDGTNSRRNSTTQSPNSQRESSSLIVLEIMMEMVRMFHAGELSSIKTENLWLDEGELRYLNNRGKFHRYF